MFTEHPCLSQNTVISQYSGKDTFAQSQLSNIFISRLHYPFRTSHYLQTYPGTPECQWLPGTQIKHVLCLQKYQQNVPFFDLKSFTQTPPLSNLWPEGRTRRKVSLSQKHQFCSNHREQRERRAIVTGNHWTKCQPFKSPFLGKLPLSFVSGCTTKPQCCVLPSLTIGPN